MITVTAPEGEFIVRKIAHLTGVLQHAVVRDDEVFIWETPWGGLSLSPSPPFASISIEGRVDGEWFENQDMRIEGKNMIILIHERGGIEVVL